MLLFAIQRASLFRFDVMFTFMIFISSLLGALPLVEFWQRIEIETLVLIALSHLCLCVGFNLVVLSRIRTGRESLSKIWPVQRTPLFEAVLYVMAALFLVVSIVSWAAGLKVPILGNIGVLNEIRVTHQFTEASGNFLTRVTALLSHFGFLYVILSPVYARRNVFKIAFVALCGIALVDFSLSTGARALIVFLGLATIATYVSLTRIAARHILGGCLLVIVALYLLGGLFYVARNPNFAINPERFLAHNCVGATFHPFLQDAPVIFKAMTLSSCYFSTPVLAFQNFMEFTEGDWSPRLGSYMLSILFREEFAQTRLELTLIFSNIGMASNPWATFARDLFIDFGFWTPIPALFIGVLFGYLSADNPSRNDVDLARFGILCAAGFIAAFMSPFLIRPIIYPLLITVLLPPMLSVISPPPQPRIPSIDQSPLERRL